jgi:hypothetical protein
MSNDILQVSGTGVVFKQTGGNVAFNPVSITPGQVRYSAQYDRGTAPRPVSTTGEPAPKRPSRRRSAAL